MRAMTCSNSPDNLDLFDSFGFSDRPDLQISTSWILRIDDSWKLILILKLIQSDSETDDWSLCLRHIVQKPLLK
jgi:hypothetical protein